MNNAVNSNDGVVDGDWEYRPLKLPPGVSRVTAAVQLSIQAEYSGWELSRVRLYADGTRRVVLRRKRTKARMPGLIV
ncbi:DUF5703 family protein [Kibdelosporangium lantanae]|uniref:DUF5703 family protein n=1 Tax=Kibdelosporangium lantanae TaxID=1497396 RepID=A0ABW3MIT4_9PSEU